jgi:uncharacterized protein YcbK (DUF882 family)
MSRRSLLHLGAAAGGLLGLALFAGRAADAQRLVLRNPATREELDVEYRRDRVVIPAAMAQIDAWCADPLTGTRHPTDPALLDGLHALAAALGSAPVFEVVSAYRAQRPGERSASLHALGRALDVRLVGVDCADLASAAHSILRGGVGYYRAPNFVHLDTGVRRSWRG